MGSIALFDIIVSIIVLVSFGYGIKDGLISSTLSLVKWFVAVIATKFALPFARPFVDNVITNQVLADSLICTITFIGSLILLGFIIKLIKKIAHKSGLSSTDRILGSILGILRGIIIVLIIFSSIDNEIILEKKLWPETLQNGFFFESVDKGSEVLIKNYYPLREAAIKFLE
jgi:membrane protein required for colicin V production